MAVAITFTYGAGLLSGGFGFRWHGWKDLGIAFIWIVLILGSRDTLRKYYARTSELLGERRVTTPSPAARKSRLSGQHS